MDILILSKIFDLMYEGRSVGNVNLPTEESIIEIEKGIGCSLPPSLIWLSQNCNYFGKWFASLGSDFENPDHILNINKIFREPDLDNPKAGLPDWYVMLNLGFDENCIGFDSRSQDPETGEYPLIYWDSSEGIGFTPDDAMSMEAYLNNLVVFWILRVVDESKKERIKKIIENQ